MIDAVLSVHTNPLTCGTAKFSKQLADRLGVPFASALTPIAAFQHPLLSVRYLEAPDDILKWAMLRWPEPYSVLWHDRDPEQQRFVGHATHVWYADDLGAPSTLVAAPHRRGEIHVLTFGMAHKHHQAHLERLRDLLEATGRSYTVGVSCAIHEGSPWADAWTAADAGMRAIFGDHLRQYGFLADDGLANAIQDATVVALFYDPAVRRNNTTLWAALAQSAIVITNLDADSPPELQHGIQVYDIQQLTAWPTYASEHRTMRHAGRALVEGRYGWGRLLQTLGAGVSV